MKCAVSRWCLLNILCVFSLQRPVGTHVRWFPIIIKMNHLTVSKGEHIQPDMKCVLSLLCWCWWLEMHNFLKENWLKDVILDSKLSWELWQDTVSFKFLECLLFLSWTSRRPTSERHVIFSKFLAISGLLNSFSRSLYWWKYSAFQGKTKL